MERSGLFNSENGDRKYSAKAIARLVSMIMANGVFNNPANNLEVEAIENSMKVKINSGRAVINGYWYENTNEIGNELTLTLPSDSNGDVIYNIVLRLSNDDRLIRAYSIKGEPNKTPKAPILTRNDNVYEICLANVLIKEGQTFINQSDITDTRLDDRVCGITRRPFEKISTEEVFRQFQAWFNEQKDTYGIDLKKWQNEHKEEYSKFEEEQKKSFEDWFAKVVKILGENPNTNLINEMDKLRKDMANLVEIYKKETYKNIEQLKEMIKTDPNIIDIQAPVKSVNGKKGEIELRAKDINCEDGKSIEENLKETITNDLNANKVKLESSKFSSNTVVGGMEELFQNVDSGKKLIRGAIIDKDSKISIPTEPTFNDLKNGISNIKTGYVIGEYAKEVTPYMEQYNVKLNESITTSNSNIYGLTVDNDNNIYIFVKDKGLYKLSSTGEIIYNCKSLENYECSVSLPSGGHGEYEYRSGLITITHNNEECLLALGRKYYNSKKYQICILNKDTGKVMERKESDWEYGYAPFPYVSNTPNTFCLISRTTTYKIDSNTLEIIYSGGIANSDKDNKQGVFTESIEGDKMYSVYDHKYFYEVSKEKSRTTSCFPRDFIDIAYVKENNKYKIACFDNLNDEEGEKRCGIAMLDLKYFNESEGDPTYVYTPLKYEGIRMIGDPNNPDVVYILGAISNRRRLNYVIKYSINDRQEISKILLCDSYFYDFMPGKAFIKNNKLIIIGSKSSDFLCINFIDLDTKYKIVK